MLTFQEPPLLESRPSLPVFRHHMYGLLNINKPARWTSRDVVNRINRQARSLKMGHAGTLDPLATGVLMVCVGPATRLVPYLHELRKTYVATFLLGQRSVSDDIDTDIERLVDVPAVTTTQIRDVLPRFLGRITQRPPAYSAVWVEGKRAYREARKGKPVQVPEREVEVTRIELLEHHEEAFTLEIECGSGTYVRSIGRDIAQACGSSAVMSALCRTRVGEFTVQSGIPPEAVHHDTIHNQLLPPSLAISGRQQVLLNAEETYRIEHGNDVRISVPQILTSAEVGICNPQGVLIAMGNYHAAEGLLVPRIVLCPPTVA